MQMTQGWTRLRNVAIALGLFAWASTSARADGILTYSTSGFVTGTIGRYGHKRDHVRIHQRTPRSTRRQICRSVRFQVAPLGPNQTTTYNNTPFSFTLIAFGLQRAPLTDFSPLTVTGVLNGTLNGRFASRT